MNWITGYLLGRNSIRLKKFLEEERKEKKENLNSTIDNYEHERNNEKEKGKSEERRKAITYYLKENKWITIKELMEKMPWIKKAGDIMGPLHFLMKKGIVEKKDFEYKDEDGIIRVKRCYKLKEDNSNG